MSKSLYGYRIGADVKEQEAATGVKLVPDNKTLLALALNDNHDDDVNPTRLKSMKEIFEHFKPSREVVLKTEDGGSEELLLKFNSLSDFSKEGIIEQSQILKDLEEKENVYSKLHDALRNNAMLQTVLSNDESKKEFLELLQILVEELNETE
jgi:hypothetical protein